MAGEGPEKDINMAIEYFEKAAHRGESTVFSTNLTHQSTLFFRIQFNVAMCR